MLFVSAYTPVAYVSNTRLDFGSILRFVENNFNLGESALGYADLLSHQQPFRILQPQPDPATISANQRTLGCTVFLNDKRPMEPPDTD